MDTRNKHNKGKHIIAEFWQCDCPIKNLKHALVSIKELKKFVQDTNLTLVGEHYHQFHTDDSNKAEVGFTLSLLLAESHCCVHTWGDLKTVTLDVYVCNHTQNNHQKADELYEKCLSYFQPKTINKQIVYRSHILQV